MNEQIKNKENTKRKLIRAVGEILQSSGYDGLGVNKIAKQAGVHKKLIYRYFGSVNFLIESYVVENDYWLKFNQKVQECVDKTGCTSLKDLFTEMFKNQFDYFLSEQEMQRLILWEISANSPLMKSIHHARENAGQILLGMTDEQLKNKNVHFRGIAALLVGGIYYTILHMQFNGGMFCGLDISNDEGQKEIKSAIEEIVGWAFSSNEGNI